MNPTTGTITSMDTYGGFVFDPTSLHKYLYANANPVSYTDPSGYFSLGEAVTVMAVSTVLGGIISGGYELFHQLASGTKWSDLNWERIKDATIKGLLAGFGIGILIVIAEAFAVAAIYEVLGYLAAYTGGKFVGLAIIDVIVYRNWKLAALDLGMALFSFWGAKKSFERAPVMSEKRAAKAAKTAESATDTSPENNSTASEGKSNTSSNSSTKVYKTKDGGYTNGKYSMSSKGNADHTTNSVWTKSGETAPKSRFMSSVDDVQATFDAAEYADAHGLWNGNKAKVFVEDGYVGVLGNGEPTQWIAVSRTETGFIHGWPCSPPH